MNGETIIDGIKGSSENKIIEIAGVHKWFGDLHVLCDINLNVYKGERIVICGPSGS
ncbi:MAG: amino acid ABC transporter ATP-binding protein, partial [Pseudomonadota bacterium]